MKMMRNVDKFRLFQWLLLLGCLLCVPHSAQAQAWDGEGDIKVYAGYANVGGRSGIELGSDYALSDFVSVGGQLTYVNVKDYDEGRDRAFMGYDFSLTGNYHWAEVLKLPSYWIFIVVFPSACEQLVCRQVYAITSVRHSDFMGRCGRISSRLLAMMWNMGASIKAKQLSLWV